MSAVHAAVGRSTAKGRSRLPLKATAALILLCLAVAGGDASAKTQYQPGAKRFAPSPITGVGDISSAQICEKGEYVVGFTGRSGAWVDRIGIRCAPLLPSGAMGEPHGTTAFGGGGGAPDRSECKVGLLKAITFNTTNGYRMVYEVFGDCVDARSGAAVSGQDANLYVVFGRANRASGSNVARDPGGSYEQRCPTGMAATGLRMHFGKDVNAIGLICDPLPTIAGGAVASETPPCPNGQIRLKGVCQVPPLLPGTQTGTGGGFIQMFPSCPAGETYDKSANACVADNNAQGADNGAQTLGPVAFGKTHGGGGAASNGNAAPQAPSAQLIEAMRVTGKTLAQCQASFPTCVDLNAELQGGKGNPVALATAQQMCAPILQQCLNNAASAQAGGGNTPQTPGDMGGMAPMQQAGGACGNGNAMATVVINQPGLDKLNVRSGPGGEVLGTVPEGETVSVLGPCGSTHGAAGFAKPKTQEGGGGGGSGWCQIGTPVHGCVSAQFLQFGGGATADAGLPNGAAGFAKSKGKQPTIASASASFAGRWSADADDVSYSLTLRQNGSGVSGSFKGSDGSVGTLSGKLNGNVLRFTWVQTDGTRGSGQFALSGDGQSFRGSYAVADDPSAGGSWNGTRQ